MTKYSGKAMNDEYEPEEGEIQDDDESIEEARLFGKGNTTVARGKESDGCSKSFSLFRGNVSKSSNRKQDSSSYGSKHSLPGILDGTSPTSPGSSRTRFRTTGIHSWYHQNRQNSTSSKERNVWKATNGIKERDRQIREKNKSSRNQYHSSFFTTPYEQRHVSSASCPPTAYFSSPIPQWHWYSKEFKDTNKRINSFVNFNDTFKDIAGSQLKETSNTNSSPKQTNTQKNAKSHLDNEVLKQTSSRPDSPVSSDSIEIIEVPRKVPEVITIDDSDEEQHTEPTKTILNLNEVVSSNVEGSMNNEIHKAILIKQYSGTSTIQQTIENNNSTPEENLKSNAEYMQHHLKELTSAMKNKYDEKKKQEIISKQICNSNETNCKMSNCSRSSSSNQHNENNLSTRHGDTILSISEPCNTKFDISVNENRSNTANTKLNEQENISNGQSHENCGHETNSQTDAILFKNISSDCGLIQNSINLVCNSVQSPSSNSSCSASNQKAPLEYVIGDEECLSVRSDIPGHTVSDICSTNQNKESFVFPNLKPLVVANSEHTNDLPTQSSMLSSDVSSNTSETIHSLHLLDKNNSLENSKLSNSQGSEIPSKDTFMPLETLLSSQTNSLPGELLLGMHKNDTTNTPVNCIIDHINDVTSTQNSNISCDTFANVQNTNTAEDKQQSNFKIACPEISSYQEKHFDESREMNRDCTPGTINALTETQKSNELNILVRNNESVKGTNVCTEFLKENVDKLHGSQIQDCITLPQSSQENSSARSTVILHVDQPENLTENGYNFHFEKIQDTEDIVGIGKDVDVKSSDINNAETTLKASSIAALKRRASQLKKLMERNSEMNSTPTAKKSGNQKLIPSVVIHRQLRDAVASVTSDSQSSSNCLSSHGNDKKNDQLLTKHTIPITPCSVVSGNFLPTSEEKHVSYSPQVMIYEDRVGTTNDENTNFREQMISRVNVTVPEFIINLGKDSDSGDDSDESSDISHSAKSDVHAISAECKGDTSVSHVTMEFEKKLDVLLKQARFQQESNPKYGRESADVDEWPGQSLTHAESQSKICTLGSTSIPSKDVQIVSFSEGCARVMPRSTIKKIVCSRVGKSKVVNHKIKSVVVKNSCGNFPRDRISHSDKTTKQFTSPMNGNKQTTKACNVTGTNRGRITRRTSSTADIGLLSPLKQKEYMKLKRQLVQMTQKKKDNQSAEKHERVASLSVLRKEDKDEEMKMKQTTVRTITISDNVQQVVEEPLVIHEQGSSHISRTPVVKPGKVLTHDQSHDNLVIKVGNEISVAETNNLRNCYQLCSSVCYPCSGQCIQQTNTMDKEVHDLTPEINNPNSNAQIGKIDNMGESCGDNICQHPLSYNTVQEKESTFHHQCGHSLDEFNEQVMQLVTNHSDIMTEVSRKRNIHDSEIALKKQKIVNTDEIYSTQLQSATSQESINITEKELVENLWSTETKLIARRCQVLEDIASVRLHLYKVEAANLRTDQIAKNIHKLKKDLKQAEEQYNKERECLNNLNVRVNDSRQSMQRGQSELLSLSLACEEIGCKVHGPNYNVPNTCVDLIRNEMMAMTEATQESENQKHAVDY